MARGQKQQADTQLGLQNQQAAQYASNASQELGPLNDTANQLIKSKGVDLNGISGFDPATMAAMTGSTMGAVNSPFAGAEAGIKRDAAIKGNDAGVGGGLTQLALDKGIAGGQAAQGLKLSDTAFKLNNADIAAQERNKGLDILQQLYGTNTQASTNLQGNAPGLLQGRAAGGGWAQGFGSVLGGIGSIVSKKL